MEAFSDGFVIIQMSSLGVVVVVLMGGGVPVFCSRGRDSSYCLEETKGVVTSLMFQK